MSWLADTFQREVEHFHAKTPEQKVETVFSALMFALGPFLLWSSFNELGKAQSDPDKKYECEKSARDDMRGGAPA